MTSDVSFDSKQHGTGRLCLGTQADVRQFLATSRAPHYVYVLRSPSQTPLYVGKGSGYRVFEHELEATGPRETLKLDAIRSIQRAGQQLVYEIDSVHEDAE